MTDNEMRIAIAEACGWKWSVPHYNHDGKWHSSPYRGQSCWTVEMSRWAGKPKNVLLDTDELPDYLNDLNAMHEAECALPNNFKREEYAVALITDDTEHSSRWDCAYATARQRAVAFLRTVGKWVE